MRIFHIRCRIDGIYFWGPGWKDAETSLKWHSYLNQMWSSNYWTVARDSLSVYLVGTNGGGMIHPMDGINFVIRESGCKTYRYVGDTRIEQHIEIDDLKKQLENLAEHCGGSVKDWEVKQYEIP